jgi:hypothetical protein
MGTTHDVDEPRQAPAQPANREPSRGFACNVTVVPAANAWEQSRPQEIPAGRLDTLPNASFCRATVTDRP